MVTYVTNYWKEDIETMARDEIEKLQLKRTKGMIKRAFDNIPFFHKKYSDAGLTPEDLKELDDLANKIKMKLTNMS